MTSYGCPLKMSRGARLLLTVPKCFTKQRLACVTPSFGYRRNQDRNIHVFNNHMMDKSTLARVQKENVSVEQYRDQYMREETIPGIDISQPTSPQELLTRIQNLCTKNKYEPLLDRSFVATPGEAEEKKKGSVRVMQWNLLAQGLSIGKDNFVRCPVECLQWDLRRIRILEEILRLEPDVVCLQEVDHYGFLASHLEKVGYEGFFFPKPDSPALYTEETNGPDGCAMFFRTEQLELTKHDPVVLQADGELCNQVCIISTFRSKDNAASSKEFLVATTHLKAKHGWGELRHKQGAWLLRYLEANYSHLPMIVTGDFNGESTEPVYAAFTESSLGLASSYAIVPDSSDSDSTPDSAPTPTPSEPPYTTFKIRGTKTGGETISCRTIDYMWMTRDKWDLTRYLSIPTDEEIGPDRLPSFRYPSDHFSLAAEYVLK